jgi:K+-transporting ATPase ATPase B chain
MKLFTSQNIIKASLTAVRDLNPWVMRRNIVMLIVEVGAVLTTVSFLGDIIGGKSFALSLQVSVWLWLTVIFSNFAGAIAEIQGKARATSLRSTQDNLTAEKIISGDKTERVFASTLLKGDMVIVSQNETIPVDGEIVKGSALVDESAITGESAPVIRESGGDRCGVTGGTKILSGTITVRISVNQGETFLDSMIKMVEGAKRQKTPNERALEILLIGLTVLFLVIVVTLPVFGHYMGVKISLPVLIALLVCLMPTTIGGLLPAIGIAGMERLLRKNVISTSGRAIEASGDVNIVLLDKTGTITLGNRMATEFISADGADRKNFLNTLLLASIADETPEGRSIVILAKKELGIHGKDIVQPEHSIFVPFSAETGMSGITIGDRVVKKGSAPAIKEHVASLKGSFPKKITEAVERISKDGDTPLVVSDGNTILGIIRLRDIIKDGITARLAQLRNMGIRSVMITGDNQLTAASIAAEAGVDDFVAQAKPETKLSIIRSYQEQGLLVAMIGDGTNDAPALAQADVAVAMNAGTQAAREAANMVDLDSSPTKLLDIVETGKEILMTRGALTTFSVANDVAKYFAIIPAIFAAAYPELGVLNIMHLGSASSAVLSAVIFNAIIIPLLIPVALKGVSYRVASVSSLLRRNIAIYGLGGILLPFAAIKLIDLVIVFIHIV